MAARPFVSFLSDFGADVAAAICRGVILGICPEASILDVSHAVRKFAIADGAWRLAFALPYLPVGIHIAVVDPGVGTERRPVGVRVARGDVLLGPDNGLLIPAAETLGGIVEARALANRSLWRETVSSTFHGRDIFAPAAAHLAAGLPVQALGPRIPELIALPPFRARRRPDGSLEAEIVSIDRFGNAITTARAMDLPPETVTVCVRDQAITGPVRTYAEAQGPAVLIGSSGYLEIAVPGGSAAAELGLRLGDRVLVVPQPRLRSAGGLSSA